MNRKTFVVLALTLAGAAATWLSTIYWLPLITNYMASHAGKCSSITDDLCAKTLAVYGTTGDMFGAVSSLFSAIALFSVALTTWADVQARREARRPLLVTSLQDDSIILDDPKIGGDRTIRFISDVVVSNQTDDAALNISISAELGTPAAKVYLPRKWLPAPVVNKAPVNASLVATLEGDDLQNLLGTLTQDGRHIELTISASYDSLEGVTWKTSVTYELRCIQPSHRARLNSVRAEAEDHQELWANNAAVALRADVKEGSWSHSKS